MTQQISKIINYTKNYDQALWSIDCLYCRLHQPNIPIDTWYDCDECCKEQGAGTPTQALLKGRFKMKLIRNVLVVPKVNEIISTPVSVETDPSIKPFFYIKGITQLNQFMKDGRKYLERNIGIKFDKDFCKAVQKKFYENKDVGMEDLVFKIDFGKATPTTKTGAMFLYILISGKFTLEELIGKAITNNLEDLE